MSGCEQLQELYEAYALGVADAAERAELEAHLAHNCPTCTPALERARWLVAHLAYLAPEAEPPRQLRRRVMESVHAPRLAGHRPLMPVWTWAAVAALLLFTLYSSRRTAHVREELAALQVQIREAQQKSRALESDRQLLQEIAAILGSASTRETSLKPARKTSLPEVRAFWNAESGVVLSGQKIPAPAAGRTFQLWVVPKKGNPISAGIFRPDPGGRVLLVTLLGAKISDAAALAISDEPAPGSPQPTTTPLWVGPLS